MQLRPLLQGLQGPEFNEDLASRVGRLMNQAGTFDIVDGAVVAGAIRRSAPIVTGDRKAIARLLDPAGADVPIVGDSPARGQGRAPMAPWRAPGQHGRSRLTGVGVVEGAGR